MALIEKFNEEKMKKVKVDIEESLCADLIRYGHFIGMKESSSEEEIASYVLTKAFEHVMSKDKEFKKYIAEQEKKKASESTSHNHE